MDFKALLGSALMMGSLACASGAEPIVSVSTALPSSANVSTASWRLVPNHAFGSEEKLSFIIKWGVIPAGYSTLSIDGQEVVDRRTAYHLVSEAHSAGVVSGFYKVQDRNDAWLDTQSLVSLRYEKRIQEGKYRIEEIVQMDQENHQFHDHAYRVDKNLFEEKQGVLPPNALDAYGSLYYVRTLPLAVGQTYTIDVLSGDKIYKLIVTVRKRETIKVPAGRFDCFLVEPLLRGPGIFISKAKKLEVWLTADESRMPVRMRSDVLIGHVSAELLSADRLPVVRPEER